jgi:hypothetical protein
MLACVRDQFWKTIAASASGVCRSRRKSSNPKLGAQSVLAKRFLPFPGGVDGKS